MTPAYGAPGSAATMRARMRSRVRSTWSPKRPANASTRVASAVADTTPVARRLRSSSHASRSKPAGLTVPCGRRSRTREAPALARVHDRHDGVLRGRRVPAERQARRHLAGPAGSVASTANGKRTPRSCGCGSSSTMPTMRTSTPSSAVGSSSARRSARTPRGVAEAGQRDGRDEARCTRRAARPRRPPRAPRRARACRRQREQRPRPPPRASHAGRGGSAAHVCSTSTPRAERGDAGAHRHARRVRGRAEDTRGDPRREARHDAQHGTSVPGRGHARHRPDGRGAGATPSGTGSSACSGTARSCGRRSPA